MLAVGMMGLLAVVGTGCGNACDDAADHLEECGLSTGDGDGDGDCTDQAEAFANCIVDKDCDSIKDGSALLDCAAEAQ
jgi:hypothetical protein